MGRFSSKFALLMGLMLFLGGTMSGVFEVKRVEASGTIYVRANGSIDPPTAPISTLDNVTYTLTGNITSSIDGIIVERDNIIIDGDQYTVQGLGASNGINVTGRSNVTVKNTSISNFIRGIYLDHTNRTTISGNNITNNDYGIDFSSSSNVSISENNITATSEYGIWLGSSSNVSISENNITANNSYGIYLASSSNNSISGNNITNNLGGVPSGGIVLIYSSNNNSIFGNKIANSSMGVWLYGCSKNSISGNNITANRVYGIYLYSSGNTISRNNIANSDYGIFLEHSSPGNKFYHNSFINNTDQAYSNSANVWDDGYPSGGNYWSNYNGTDADHDGIGDTPYVIDANNTDLYPLMGMFSEFNVSLPNGRTENVTVISNSTVSNLSLMIWLSSPYDGLQPGQPFVQFTAAGENGSVGFCRLMIPRAVLNSSSYIVLVDSHPINATELPVSNSTHAYLYFIYDHSTHEVIVTIPEFSWLILSLFMIATLLAIIVYKRKHVQRE